MQFIRIQRRVGAIVAIALAAAAISASVASARVLEGPIHQTAQAGQSVPPVLPAVPPSQFRAIEAQDTAALGYRLVPTAPYSNAELNAHLKPVLATTTSVHKIAAPSDSFNWGDAAIGAGVAMAIVALVSGGTLAVRRRTQFGEA